MHKNIRVYLLLREPGHFLPLQFLYRQLQFLSAL